MNKLWFLIICICLVFFTGCEDNKSPNPDKDPVDLPHECIEGEWEFTETTKCLEEAVAALKCSICNNPMEIAVKKKLHNEISEEKEATCSEDGYFKKYCTDCSYNYVISIKATGIHDYKYEIFSKATETRLGLKQKTCSTCGEQGEPVKYAANGFLDHGKLSVVGPDLVDEHGEKFQLVGISTHGLQWFAQ